ncbi:11656_t:CDS:2, partial [Ambispora leptoticha]
MNGEIEKTMEKKKENVKEPTSYSYHASTTISPTSSITPPIKKSKQSPTLSTAIMTVTTPSDAAGGETAIEQSDEVSLESQIISMEIDSPMQSEPINETTFQPNESRFNLFQSQQAANTFQAQQEYQSQQAANTFQAQQAYQSQQAANTFQAQQEYQSQQA